jgi:hypothetical protein
LEERRVTLVESAVGQPLEGVVFSAVVFSIYELTVKLFLLLFLLCSKYAQ